MITMQIHNNQGAWMGEYSGETPIDLLQAINDSNYDLSDCTGSTDDYIYDGSKIVSNDYDREVVAE